MIRTRYCLICMAIGMVVVGCGAGRSPVGGTADTNAEPDDDAGTDGVGTDGPDPTDPDAGGGEPDPDDDADAGPIPPLVLTLVHAGLDEPVDLQAAPDGTGRLFIVERAGRIRISADRALQDAEAPFLDIADLVTSAGGEQGLLGLAFHPEFADNGRFYVNHTGTAGAADVTFVVEYAVSDDPDRADPDSRSVLLTVEQPFLNHNGGQLQFGPDGMLYVGLGDGGSGCDPGDRAQDPQSLLGKMLRLDVDRPPGFVPADNPVIADEGAEDLIWALGLRNPWRFSFDPATGELYIADVGQGAREEIDVLTVDPARPPNLGWRTFEGTASPAPGCDVSAFDATDAIDPVFEYGHDEGCSITGGYVYGGRAIPELDGLYFYSDYCNPSLRTLRVEGGALTANDDLTDLIEQRGGSLDNPTSFGVDAEGELYVLDQDGDVFSLELAD
ncbi:MAG: PQQ-dependent sugar dehydrogenase [bacterium]|nr:PQQ-dependent sugar dehydrogenase [bacterium]